MMGRMEEDNLLPHSSPSRVGPLPVGASTLTLTSGPPLTGRETSVLPWTENRRSKWLKITAQTLMIPIKYLKYSLPQVKHYRQQAQLPGGGDSIWKICGRRRGGGGSRGQTRWRMIVHIIFYLCILKAVTMELHTQWAMIQILLRMETWGHVEIAHHRARSVYCSHPLPASKEWENENGNNKNGRNWSE